MEGVDPGAASGVDEPLDHAPVQSADDVGKALGQLAERAVRKGNGRLAVVLDRGGVESQSVEPGHQGIEAAPAAEVTVSVPGLRELALGAGSPRRVSRSCSFAAGRSGPGLARALGLQGVDLALLAPGL